MPLSKSAGPATWIHDFVHSDNSRFAGKSKAQRIKMALAAYYSKQRESSSLVTSAVDLLELGQSTSSIGTNPYSRGNLSSMPASTGVASAGSIASPGMSCYNTGLSPTGSDSTTAASTLTWGRILVNQRLIRIRLSPPLARPPRR
jgi:hypothetical protein